MKPIALKTHRGRLVIEVPAILRIPVLLDVVRQRAAWLCGINLTQREKEALDGILAGLVNKEIASQANTSVRTVKFHVSNLLGKFQVRSRRELRNLFGEGEKR